MAFIDEKTKGTNKQVIEKILQCSYDRKHITRKDVDDSVERLQEIAPTLYAGITVKYRDEDLTEEEREQKGE